MICRDALRGKPESVGVYASERLSFSFSERPQGKPRSKPNREIRLPGLQGGPRKRDFVVLTRCAPRLYPDLQPMKPGRSDLTLSTVAFPDLTQRPQLTNHASAGLM